MGSVHGSVIQEEIEVPEFVFSQGVFFVLRINIEESDDFRRDVPVVDHPHAASFTVSFGRPADLAQALTAWDKGPGSRVAAEVVLQFGISVLPEVAQHA